VALQELPDYPWDLMAPYAERARAHADGLVDLSIGSPVDPTPDLIREALASATDAHAYPQTVGTPALREAIVDWFHRRRGVRGLTVENVLPTIGSKELVALLPFMLGLGDGDTVVHPRAAYPTYAIGAAIAGATAIASDDPAEWPAETRLVWLNSPGNPDGRVLDVDGLRRAVDAARLTGTEVSSERTGENL
jgi:aspartate/methionine/tyrosine aminotransferase